MAMPWLYYIDPEFAGIVPNRACHTRSELMPIVLEDFVKRVPHRCMHQIHGVHQFGLEGLETGLFGLYDQRVTIALIRNLILWGIY